MKIQLKNQDYDLIENPTPRCPCMLVLDVSGSMSGDPISLLNQGVNQFIQEVYQDDFARFAVEVGIITFGSTVDEVIPIQSILEINVPAFSAMGRTPMGEAVSKAIEVLEVRKQQYQKRGVSYYQPWIVLMTDGEPTDDKEYPNAAALLRELAEDSKMLVFGIGIGDHCNLNKLGKFCPANRPPKKLAEYRFREFFQWLAQSMAKVSVSTPGTGVELPSIGWDKIQI
ncbi:VWA domain-containing protein [Microcoleus sp. herbarium14]|uniref:vWA domain-containing protein n=1 Tax=Microcoleus sp. herbarium14 TaxID=3055439 RepID=UPI002FD55294